MSKLYGSYINQIEKAINLHSGARALNLSAQTRTYSSTDLMKSMMAENRSLEPKTGMHTLAELLGIAQVKKPFKGDHPDFASLRLTKGMEYHYIVSMFIDVQGSTNFHRKYDLEQIALIIQTIVSAAIHTVSLFDGHVQRLQYDGVFCYFGGKGVDKNAAVKAAVNAASFFSYFIKYELRDVFQIESIESIYTRVGIDFGDDAEVQWTIFGLDDCDELTTNSLHTSLAPKMQANASANGIMIGKNVRDRLGEASLYTDFIRDNKGNVDESYRYIYKDQEKGFYYSQHSFEWKTYLKNNFWFVSTDSSGNLTIDYSGSKKQHNQQQDQLQRLYEKTTSIGAGTASINQQAQIVPNSSAGTPIPANRFYYDEHKEG